MKIKNMLNQITEFVSESKKHLIIIGVMSVSLLIVNSITLDIKASADQQLIDMNMQIVAIKNEYQQYKTEASEDLQYEHITSQNSEIKWVGNKVDTAKSSTYFCLCSIYSSPDV